MRAEALQNSQLTPQFAQKIGILKPISTLRTLTTGVYVAIVTMARIDIPAQNSPKRNDMKGSYGGTRVR